MSTQHTPGPWRAVKHTVWTGEPNTTKGPIVEASGSTIKQAEANARLIAAAPNLLAALKEIVNAIHVYNPPRKHDAADNLLGDALMDADAAIAKAGETS